MKVIHYNKLFLFVMLLLAFTVAACNNEEKEANQDKADKMKADAQVNTSAEGAAGFNIFEINEVTNLGKGKAPDFTWTENGQTKSFSEMTKGKVVFVNFWGSWCPPCRREVPDIVKLKNEFANDSLVVIGIAIERDQTNARQKVASFGDSKSINYTNFLFKPEVIDAYGGINAVPSTFIVDKEGNIVETIVGARTYEQFKQSLERVMKKPV